MIKSGWSAVGPQLDISAYGARVAEDRASDGRLEMPHCRPSVRIGRSIRAIPDPPAVAPERGSSTHNSRSLQSVATPAHARSGPRHRARFEASRACGFAHSTEIWNQRHRRVLLNAWVIYARGSVPRAAEIAGIKSRKLSYITHGCACLRRIAAARNPTRVKMDLSNAAC
jgi:hypothetical protein